MSKKQRRRNGPPRGAVVLYRQRPESRWIHQWLPPRGAAAFFSMGSDAEFKARHPVGYGFLVALGIFALLLPMLIYDIAILNGGDPELSGWLLAGLAGSFLIGVGLFNFVAIIIRQYLGHLVSLLSFLAGGVLVALSLRFL